MSEPKVWQWEANDDCCDECEAKEGIHISETKPTTHSDCKCSIEEMDVDGEEEIRAFTVTETDEEVTIHDHIDNCYNFEEIEEEVSYEFDAPEESYENDLLKAKASSEWQAPASTVLGLERSVHVPADSHADVTVNATKHKAEFGGELWWSAEVEGVKIAHHITDVCGHWEGFTDAETGVSVETCKIVIDDPPPL